MSFSPSQRQRDTGALHRALSVGGFFQLLPQLGAPFRDSGTPGHGVHLFQLTGSRSCSISPLSGHGEGHQVLCVTSLVSKGRICSTNPERKVLLPAPDPPPTTPPPGSSYSPSARILNKKKKKKSCFQGHCEMMLFSASRTA